MDKQLPTSPAPLSRQIWLSAGGLLVGFLLLYHLNGDFLVGNDATPNVYLAVSLLTEGDFVFTPEDNPSMFIWHLYPPKDESATEQQEPQPTRAPMFRTWDDVAEEETTYRQLRDQGRLKLFGPYYYLVPTPDTAGQKYVGMYGAGTGLVTLPAMAVASLFADLPEDKRVLWYVAKLVAATCVAISVVFVFLAGLEIADHRAALVAAFVYGAGTSVWSLSSQTLWQSGPAAMFVAASAWLLLRGRNNPRLMAACGAAAGCAVLCRPTSAVWVLVVGGFLLADVVRRLRAKDRGTVWQAAAPLVCYALAGLPFAAFLLWYNAQHLGSPLAAGQVLAGERMVIDKLGPPGENQPPGIWSENWWVGFCGLLFSPSRGLLVYSPVLAFGLVGMLQSFRSPRFAMLRPMGVTFLLLLAVYSKYFDWPGGWSYGYRLLIDAVPLLCLCMLARADEIRTRPPLAVAFAALTIWSIGVQVIGAWAYNIQGWNNRACFVVQKGAGPASILFDREQAIQLQREGYQVSPGHADVDRRVFRYRLWSVTDSQLLYYLKNFTAARQVKRRNMEYWLAVAG